jgi:flagellin
MQQINATNNTFELNVDGAGYQTVTLDGTNDLDGAGGATYAAGEYDSAATLADQINFAISDATSATYADNANLRDADGNALVTASDDGNGGITFTSTSVGENSSVVARTGPTGSIAIPSGVVETTGSEPDAAVEVNSINFIFDGTNSWDLSTNGSFDITTTGVGGTAAAGDLDVSAGGAAGVYTNAQDLADALNTAITADANISGQVAARVSEEGTKVELYTTDPGLTGFSLVAAAANEATQNYLGESFQHLSNGDAVMVDPVDFFGAATGVDADEDFALVVDGVTAGDINFDADPGLGTTLADATGGTITQQVDYLNDLFSTQAAGTGVTASAVGDQIVLSSISGGSVQVTAAAAGTQVGTGSGLLGIVSLDSALNAETTESVAGVGGTATTGAFSNVSDGTDGFAQGTFLSTDYDGTGTDFETKASPLVIEAGVNDTFGITVDGGTEQTVTITAGSYDTMDELSTAINAAAGVGAQKVTAVDLGTVASTEYDLDGAGADNFELNISYNGSTAADIVLAAGDYDTGDLTTTRDAFLLDVQANLDGQFGAGAITAEINGNELQLSTSNGEALTIGPATNAAFGLGDGDFTTVSGTNVPSYSSSTSVDKQSLVFTSASTGTSSAIELNNDGFAITAGAADGEILQSEVNVNALESGDLVLNGTAIGAANALSDTASDTTADSSDAAASGIATAAAINASTEQTGVTAEVNATTLTGGTTTTAASGTELNSIGTVWINNVETNTIQLTGDADRDRASAIDSINALSGQTGVTAEDNGESITLTAADGRNISVAIDNKLAENDTAGRDSSNFGSKIGLDSSQQNIGEADFGGTSADFANTAGTTYSTVTLKAAGEINIENGVNGTDEVEALGLQIGSYGGGESGTYLADMDISTFEGAQAAISAIDNALQTVSSQRAELGALQNRFESTSSNLQITSENLSAANSRIRDADFAAETAELSRTQVLQQAGISILAQANQRPQQVLSLLG